jgi:hypothetical protein
LPKSEIVSHSPLLVVVVTVIANLVVVIVIRVVVYILLKVLSGDPRALECEQCGDQEETRRSHIRRSNESAVTKYDRSVPICCKCVKAWWCDVVVFVE